MGGSIALKSSHMLPDFLLPTMGGSLVSSKDIVGKKNLLLYFWASWDKSSRELLPYLQSFAAANRQTAEVVAVDLDLTGLPAPMRSLRESNAGFTTLIDACAVSRRLFGLSNVPVLLAVDRGGVVAAVSEAPDRKLLDAWGKKFPSNDGSPIRWEGEKSPGGIASMRFEILLQSCINFLGRGRKEDALRCLEEAAKLHPELPIVTRQIALITLKK